VVATAACDEKLSDVTGPSPNLEPTFASINANILQATDAAGRSACVGCHTSSGRTPAGQLNLAGDAYSALVNVGSRQRAGAVLVVPGDPDASYLVRKLEGGPDITGRRMPLNGPPYLTDGQMLVVRRWIQQGARND
jgi:hypothetical protein